MKVRVQSVNFNVDQGLIDFIDSKINNLEKFYDKIIDADVFLKVQKTSEKENKMADVKLNIAGDELIVKKQCKTFEESIDLAVDSLRRQLNKKKDKLRAHY